MDTGKSLSKRIYKNSLHCFKKIYKQEGINGFYSGCLSNALQGLGSSLMLVLYDDFKAYFTNPTSH